MTDNGNGTTIPAIRAMLLDIAGDLDVIAPVAAARIRECVDLMYRRPAVRNAPPSARELTGGLILSIRAYAQLHPSMTEADIGHVFDVNQGRVSEALHGKRT
jgi:hypothetical protein